LVDRVPEGERTRLRYWYQALRGRLDRELAVVRGMLAPGAHVVDIGANTGLYAYALGRTHTMDAFEPLPESARSLRAVAKRLPRVRVHEVALSSRPGTATLYIPYVDGRPTAELARFTPPASGRFDEVTVPVSTLDAFGLSPVGLIKIDVEGHELSVLEGAEATIARERPMLFIEIEQRHSSTPIADTFAAVAAYGYRGFFVNPDRQLRPIAEFRYERDQAAYVDDPTDTPYANNCYVNNFLFLAGD
jgi:FkbM family methyltransferase